MTGDSGFTLQDAGTACTRDGVRAARSSAWLRACFCVLAWCLAQSPAVALAQTPPLITEVHIEQEGRTVSDRLILGLMETTPGEPLSMRDVRDTLAHLANLTRFEDVQVFQEPAAGGIRLRYVLVPKHPVDRLEFSGVLVLPDGELRRALTDRFGAVPPAAGAAEAVEALRELYRDRGYTQASVTSRIDETHGPDRATMTFAVQAGPRAALGAVDISEVDGADRPVTPEPIAIRVGDPYDDDAIARELARYEASLRARGFYEARAVHSTTFAGDGVATVRIAIDRGPLVTVTFTGDPLPDADRERLVPVRVEGSADEDLLEDANSAIEQYLHARGYRDASVAYTRMLRDGELTITFAVRQGRRHVVSAVTVEGHREMSTAEVAQLLLVAEGDLFVQATLDEGVAAIRGAYRTRGFTRASVRASLAEPAPTEGAGSQAVQVRIEVTEGARTLVGTIAFEGNTVFTDLELLALMATAADRAYSETEIASDRDRLELEYLDRGYESVVVSPEAVFADSGTRADIRVAVSEGVQAIVDHVIIVGNDRTSTETIERALLLKPGQPLGYSARIESQQRLAALGLFRRVTIEEARHTGGARRDVLVQVEEAPPLTVGIGGGIEGGFRLRPTGEGGRAEERFELAPRGFFEISRRNLWGKNRSINLFTRVSFRSRDVSASEGGPPVEGEVDASRPGFNEYRVLATFREPRVFNTAADVLVTGILDQAIRSSFNFITREARAEVGVRLSPRYSLAGRYSYQHTRLFDERFTDSEKPLIDRIFPQVRLSKMSGTAIRDTRNDVLDAERGTFVILDSVLAARGIGSEVGFVKTFVQAFTYYRMPAARRTVLALGARVGAAHGFPRAVPLFGADGQPVLDAGGNAVVEVVQDLPASERFFAGGDTTVRGYSLDRLGSDATISPTGFPTGGNGVVVLNGELRVAVVGGLGAVGFLDAGNVFPRAADLDVTRLRAAAGFGVFYRSPVGPIRIDLGFKLDRRELTPGRLERRSVLHVSLGQAF